MNALRHVTFAIASLALTFTLIGYVGSATADTPFAGISVVGAL